MDTDQVLSLKPPDWDVVDWEAEWQRLTAELRQLENDKELLTREIATTEQEHRALQDSVTALGAEADKLRGIIHALQKEQAEMNAKIIDLGYEEGAQYAKIDDLRGRIADLSIQEQGYAPILDALEQERRQRQFLCDKARNALAMLKKQIATIERREEIARENEQRNATYKQQTADREAAVMRREQSVAARENDLARREAIYAEHRRWLSKFKQIATKTGEILFLICMGSLVMYVIMAILSFIAECIR